MAEATLEGSAAVAGTPPGTAFVNAYGSFSEFKYGCNPHQQPAGILRCDRAGQDSPFEVINGKPGYINMLDAANAWQLVDELRDATGITAATSFKHVSPAGAALAVPLKKEEADAYEIPNPDGLSPAALAYVRAQQADPMSSFGDFAAISCKVDEATAKTLKPLVCDGIVAPEFSPAAIDILRKKKGGNFIILQADRNFQPPELEFREVFGTCLMQKRNGLRLSVDEHLERNVVCGEQPSEEVLRDMILSLTVLKYTQSNSVGYAKNGQMVGVGAGQQSRVDCCKLAGRKVAVWALRQHPKVMGLKFKDGVKKQDRVNARVRYIEGDFTPIEWESWSSLFTEVPPPLTADEKANFMSSFSGVTLSSDAFSPFATPSIMPLNLGLTLSCSLVAASATRVSRSRAKSMVWP